MFYGGTTVNVGQLTGTPINVYYDNTVIDPSATSPAGLSTSSGTGGSSQIAGATSQAYIPVTGDVGNALTVSVVAKNTSGSSVPATSVATATVAAAVASVPVDTALPTISGTTQVGQTLTATNGTWANSPTSFTYQWNRAGNAITGATASAYVPVAADVGNTLAVSVVATNSR
jgi:hypothetical protein